MNANNFQAWGGELERRYADFASAEPRTENGPFFVTSAIDYTRAAAQERTVEAILSSTNPVARWSYDQVLEHTDSAVDLHRLVDGGLPLLYSHDPYQIIGRAENIRVHQGQLRASLRFSKSAKGEEVWRDVLDGIATGISIGFDITTSKFDEETQRQTVTRWTPMEASVVAMPADITARIERSLKLGLFRECPADVRALSYQHDLHDHYKFILEKEPGIIDSPKHKDALAGIRQRMQTVKSLSDQKACRDLLVDTAFDFIHSKDTGGEIRTFRTAEPSREYKPMESFSLCRAIAMQFDPESARAGGPELDIMRDVARQTGKRDGGQYRLPDLAVFTRAVTKGTTGGNLVGVQHLGMEFVPVLRSRLLTGRLGATLLTGLTGDLQIPKGLTDSAAGWIAGDGSDQVGASDPTYGKLQMSPKTVGVKSTLSRKMILQGDPNSEMLLRDSLSFAVAKAIDSACLVGNGTGNVPKGILSTSGIASGTYANAGAPSFANIVDLEGALMVDDADMGSMAYVTTGTLASKMKKTEIVATTGQMIWTSNGEGEGVMNGRLSLVSNIVPAGYIVFGNWKDLVIGMWSGFDFTVDPYTRAAYGDVIITLLVDCDVVVRHGESFAEIHEAAP